MMPETSRPLITGLLLAALRAMSWRPSTYVLLLGAAFSALAPFSALRAEFANPDGVAVIIGNRTYAGDIQAVEFAHRDAEAFRRYVLEVLGFDPENVIYLRNATQAQMWSAFGNRVTTERSELWSYLAEEGSDVVVYYSGHGVPGVADKRGYLLPVDADPNTAELNGYPIDVLYANLANLRLARSVAVYLDACFSGGSGGGGMLIDAASPVYVQASLPEVAGGKLTVLSAASGKELASWDKKSGHGMFTHHLLDALYGKGDADGDGRVTAREAKRYLDRHMTRAAKRTYKRRQHAGFAGNADTVLASVGPGGGFPPRPVLGEVEGGTSGGVKEVVPSPVETAKAEEKGLGLPRSARVLVQDGLASVGFSPGESDGLFGAKTRGALRGWQKRRGLEETGYLTREQSEVLMALAEKKRMAEAARKAVPVEPKPAPSREPLTDPAEVLLASGLRLSDWVLLAEDRLGSGEHRAVLVEGAGHLRAHGRFASVESVVERALDGLVEGIQVRDERSARTALGSVERLRAVVGERAELARIEAKAYARLGGFPEAVSAYRKWLGLVPASHPERRAMLAAMQRAERGERDPVSGEGIRDCDECPELVVVPAGSFMMGSPSSEAGRDADQGPVHRVTIAAPFAVGVNEVTRGEYARFVAATGRGSGGSCRTFEGGKWEERSGRDWRRPGFNQTDAHPVVCVDWEDAKSYVRWMSGETGKEYRLLSESEWEYAARGGTGTARYWGESASGQCRYGNGADRSLKRRYSDWRWDTVGCDDGAVHTAEVGTYEANGYGLHDVLGNVWEWVGDCWHDSYAGAPSDGSAWTGSGDCGKRVLRGGSWFFEPGDLRSAYRSRGSTGFRDNDVGFRVARTLD